MQYLDLNTLNLNIHIIIEILAIIIALIAIIQTLILKLKVIPELRKELINPEELSDIKEQINNLTTKVQELENDFTNNSEISDTELVDIYNHYRESESLLNTIEVSGTPESYELHQKNNHHAIVLRKVEIGNGYYWVFRGKDSSYIVPKKGIRINIYNHEAIEALFICHDYQSEYSNNFELLKPAKVSAISQGQTWQLQQKGELQIISHEPPLEPDLILVYNNSPNKLSEQAIEVSQKPGSQQLILERVRRDRGSFWVLISENEFYIVPKYKIKITYLNYPLLASLFICKDYQEGKSEKFKLIKPGKLTVKIPGKTWELKEKGELQF